MALVFLLLACASPRPLNDGFRQKLDAGCDSYASCDALVHEAIERSKNCREEEAGYVSCAEARADHKMAVMLFAPYERSAAYAARLEQERREREAAVQREAELRRSEEELAVREAEQRRAEEEAQAAELERRVRVYLETTAAARQQALIDCYRKGGEERADLVPSRRSCEALLEDLLTAAESEQERSALRSTWGRLEADVDAEIERLRRQEEAAQRREAAAREQKRSASAAASGATAGGLTDAQIRKALIAESIAGYSGNCPCPYNTDRAGRSCGRRSAHSRAGGESPLCFDEDVTREMIDAYRRQHASN
jgi:hypothetical protein